MWLRPIDNFQDVAAKGGVIKSEYSILYGAIALIFLINAMQLSPEKLREHVTNWHLHIVVQGINLVLIPIIQLSPYLDAQSLRPG